MRLHRSTGGLLLWAVALPIFAQPPDAGALVRRAVALDSRSAALLSDYVYSERIETTSLRSGRVRSKVFQHLFLDGRPVVERNGKVHGEDKSRKQWRKTLADVAVAYDFRLYGETHCCWKIAAEPKAGFRSHSAIDARLLPDLAGAIWIDRSSGMWVRIEASVIHHFRLGLFLFTMAAGSHVSLHQSRIHGQLWHVDRLELRFKGRVLWARGNIDQVRTYYGFRRFNVHSSVTYSKH